MFFGRNDAEAETPVVWLPDVKGQLIRIDLDAGKDQWQKEKRGNRGRDGQIASLTPWTRV